MDYIKKRKSSSLIILARCLFLASMLTLGDGGMTFPITVGGFNGDTIIQKIASDPSKNFVIAGISSDNAIVSAVSTNFIMYLNVGGNQWLWKK